MSTASSTPTTFREATAVSATGGAAAAVSEASITFGHPCRILIVGSTGSGKSELVLQFIRHRHLLFTGAPFDDADRIYYCLPRSFQTASHDRFCDRLRALAPGCHVVYGLPDFASLFADKTWSREPKLVVLDDLITELVNDPQGLLALTVGSHHAEMSLLITSQNYFMKGKHSVSIARNMSHKVFLVDHADKTPLRAVSRNMFPAQPLFLPQCMAAMLDWPSRLWTTPLADAGRSKRASKNAAADDRPPRPYLVIDCSHSHASSECRVRTRIFPFVDPATGHTHWQPLIFQPASARPKLS